MHLHPHVPALRPIAHRLQPAAAPGASKFSSAAFTRTCPNKIAVRNTSVSRGVVLLIALKGPRCCFAENPGRLSAFARLDQVVTPRHRRPRTPQEHAPLSARRSLSAIATFICGRRTQADSARRPADSRSGTSAHMRVRRLDRTPSRTRSRRPESAADVEAAVRGCTLAGVPFVARGAGTGLSGGAFPVADGIAISLARLNRRRRGTDAGNLWRFRAPARVTSPCRTTPSTAPGVAVISPQAFQGSPCPPLGRDRERVRRRRSQRGDPRCDLRDGSWLEWPASERRSHRCRDRAM
jgi:FAD binding domain